LEEIKEVTEETNTKPREDDSDINRLSTLEIREIQEDEI